MSEESTHIGTIKRRPTVGSTFIQRGQNQDDNEQMAASISLRSTRLPRETISLPPLRIGKRRISRTRAEGTIRLSSSFCAAERLDSSTCAAFSPLANHSAARTVARRMQAIACFPSTRDT
jgi:hypothetical protein